MRGDTATENEVEADVYGDGAAAETSGERRPSIVKLQSMLKKVSQSPFHSRYKTLVPSTSDSSGSSVNESQNKQDGEFLSDLSAAATGVTDNQQLQLEQDGFKMDDNHLLAVAKRGVNGGSASMNPFYAHYLESGSKGHLMEDVGGKPSGVHLDTIFAPPSDFQSSPLDLQTEIKSAEDGAELSEPPLQGSFQTSTLPQNPFTNGHSRDITPSSPDLFRPVPAQRQNLSETLELKSSELIKDEGVDLFRAAKGQDLFHAERTREVSLSGSPSIFADPFKSPSNKENDLFRSPQPNVTNPFHTAKTDGADLFSTKNRELFHKQDPSTIEDLFGVSSKKTVDIFSPLSTNTADPFPSPITRDLFQDVSSLDDPFGPTPSKQYNPSQDVTNRTPDIFQPLPLKTVNKDVFEITPSSATSVATYSTPSFNSPSDLFKSTPSGSNQATQAKCPDEIVLTTPQGTKQDILQPTPFTRARNLSMSPGQSPSEMTHVTTFRRPPKPLPRIRPPSKEKPPPATAHHRTEMPPKPEPTPPTPTNYIEPVPKTSTTLATRPLPKPVIPRKPRTPENKRTDPEDYAVFEDILLIGQERCVEDWPEDSPQLDPDFKPSGTLRLRRESLNVKADSDGGSGEDQEGSGSHGKKKDKKFRMSLLSRRGSKEKFADDTKEGRSRTLPTSRKSSKEYLSDVHTSAEEYEDPEQYGMDYKKKPPKTKVNQLLRRASTNSSVPERKHMNGHLTQESKDGDLSKKSIRKEKSTRRWSEGKVLDNSAGEEEEVGGAQHEEKRKKTVKIKFVPQRGFAIMKTEVEPKGAHGYTPRKSSKEKSQDEVQGAHGYTPRKTSQDDAIEDVAELTGHSLQPTSKAHGFMEDEQFQRTRVGLDEDEDPFKMADCRPKKSKHKNPPPVPPKTKKTNAVWEPAEFSHHVPQQASSDVFAEGDIVHTGTDSRSPEQLYDGEQEVLETCKATKPFKFKGFKKHKAKNKATQLEYEDPPGATSTDLLSEAAKAEWRAAQMDEHTMPGLEEDDQDGDTDSLMEWWDTVEQWDELPSDDEEMREDEFKSFTVLAGKVHRGLRLFNKIFTERAEALWQSIINLHAIADDISNFHNKAVIAGITGGTTTAVGGAAAVAGLVLAPFTFGFSLIITAVGVGVATAGGITSASAAISDSVNNMHERKKVEVVLEDYEGDLKDISKILHFVNQGLYKLRGHPFLRSGTQHYSGDWEVRRAVQTVSLVDTPVMRAVEITDSAVASVQALFTGMDKYFVKDSRELKKGVKTQLVTQIKHVANILNDVIVELNIIREGLQDATGSI